MLAASCMQAGVFSATYPIMGILASPLAVRDIFLGELAWIGVMLTQLAVPFSAVMALSGTFFPIAELPMWGKVVAQLTPLFHGVELVRQLTIYDLEASAIWHLGYLVALLGVGALLGIRNFERRLVP